MSAGLGYRCCHPSHAQRTKCLCGEVVTLRGAFGSHFVRCKCGRAHRKTSQPGGSFASGSMIVDGCIATGRRLGGKAGCPGIDA